MHCFPAFEGPPPVLLKLPCSAQPVRQKPFDQITKAAAGDMYTLAFDPRVRSVDDMRSYYTDSHISQSRDFDCISQFGALQKVQMSIQVILLICVLRASWRASMCSYWRAWANKSGQGVWLPTHRHPKVCLATNYAIQKRRCPRQRYALLLHRRSIPLRLTNYIHFPIVVNNVPRPPKSRLRFFAVSEQNSSQSLQKGRIMDWDVQRLL